MHGGHQFDRGRRKKAVRRAFLRLAFGKRYVEAIRQFNQLIAREPANPQAYDCVALDLEPMGQIERADAAYQRALKVNQGPQLDSFLDYNYGRFLMKRNRLAESKKHLDRAVELTPNVRAVRYERGTLNFRPENYQDARNDAERELCLQDPGNVIIDLQIYNLLQLVRGNWRDSMES